jgi:hypothetical protein
VTDAKEILNEPKQAGIQLEGWVNPNPSGEMAYLENGRKFFWGFCLHGIARGHIILYGIARECTALHGHWTLGVPSFGSSRYYYYVVFDW